VAPYLIFSDAVLIELASWLPLQEADLLRINGIGTHKAQLYGEKLLDIIQAYCKQYQLETRMPDMRRQRKTAPTKLNSLHTGKGSTYDISLEMYKSGKSIADIAAIRELKATTIEGHLSIFVAKGKLAATEVVPEARLKAIQQAIAGNENQPLSDLKNILGDAYSYGELRIALADIVAMAEK
jgi:ATP-dependent DNA helicase RecQ